MSDMQIRRGAKLVTKSGKTIEVVDVHLWLSQKGELIDAMVQIREEGVERSRLVNNVNLIWILENN